MLPLLLGEICEPGFDELLRAKALLDVVVKPALEVCVLVKISKSTEPKLPGLHIACGNADRYTIQAPVIQACFANGFPNIFTPPLKPGVIGIDDHQQAHSLTGALAKVARHLREAGKNEGEAAIASAWLDPDAVKLLLENWAEQSLLLDVLAEQ